MNLSEGNIRLLAEMFKSVQGKFASATKAGIKDSTSDGEILRNLGKGLSAIYSLEYHPAVHKDESQSMSGGRSYYNSSWFKLALDELGQFNQFGDHYVGSLSEAVWKVHGVLKAWYAGSGRNWEAGRATRSCWTRRARLFTIDSGSGRHITPGWRGCFG